MNLKFFWINIGDSINRKNFMEIQFKNLNYDNKRIEAITPNDFDDVLEDKPPYFCGNQCCILNDCKDCKFEFACNCSHLKAIRDGYEEGHEYFIVCEDDIYMPFEIDFENLIKNLPIDFEIFQMMVLDDGATQTLYDHLKKTKEFYVKYNPNNAYYSTGMYIITHNGAKRILDNLINNMTLKFDFRHIDYLKQADFLLYLTANTYTTSFPLCIPNINLISEIHPQHILLHKNSILKILDIMNNLNDYPFIKKLNKISNNFNIKYYWINLDNAIERKKYMEEQFTQYNMDNERISAKTPNDLNDILQDKPPYFCGYKECFENKCKNCPIEFATICSHLEAIKKGFLSGAEYFIVCEDDVTFKFIIDFEKIIKSTPDFEILQMMIISKDHLEYFYNEGFIKNSNFINYTPIIPSAAFYLISNKGAKKIIEKFTNNLTNKWDFKDFNNLKLADVLIYESAKTIVSTFPLCSFNINFKSQIHSHHFKIHNEAYEAITKIHKNYKLNPFIINSLST
jgi:GR25 family glycosyltransferase involved in LPS biosynthesis